MLIYYVQSKYGKHIRGIAVPDKHDIERELNDKADEIIRMVLKEHTYDELKFAIVNAMKWARNTIMADQPSKDMVEALIDRIAKAQALCPNGNYRKHRRIRFICSKEEQAALVAALQARSATDRTKIIVEAIAAAEAFSDVIHALEASGVNLSKQQEKMWAAATARLEAIRSLSPPRLLSEGSGSMSPEADRIHTRLLRYQWMDHKADNCRTAIEAAVLIKSLSDEVDRLRQATKREGT